MPAAVPFGQMTAAVSAESFYKGWVQILRISLGIWRYSWKITALKSVIASQAAQCSRVMSAANDFAQLAMHGPDCFALLDMT